MLRDWLKQPQTAGLLAAVAILVNVWMWEATRAQKAEERDLLFRLAIEQRLTRVEAKVDQLLRSDRQRVGEERPALRLMCRQFGPW